jgi:hypothetical protein
MNVQRHASCVRLRPEQRERYLDLHTERLPGTPSGQRWAPLTEIRHPGR